MSFRASSLVAALAAALVVVGSALSAPTAAADSAELLTIKDERVTESSGLVASAQHPGVYWTHNDSGDAPRLFAIGSDGRTKAVLTLQGVSPRDWEAVSLGKDDAGRPALFVGDIGDNKGTWSEVWIYRVPEPAELRDATVKPVKYRLTYEGGPRDAEALLVDPRTDKVYIASKGTMEGALYEQPAVLSPSGLNVFRRIADAPGLVTDGAFSPDGSRFILRGYFSSDMYSAPGKRVGAVVVPFQRQGESAAFTPDGRAVLFGSEGAGSSIVKVTLDGANLPTGSAPRDEPKPGQDPSASQAAPQGDAARSAAPGAEAPAGGGDQDGAGGEEDKTTAYGPGFLAVVGIVVAVYLYIKLRRRRASS